jgi:hypothetical protein
MRTSFSGCTGLDVSQCKMFSDTTALGNRRRDKLFSDFNRARQIVSERERGANRGGISAAGSVRADAFDKWRGQKQFRFAVEENVGGLLNR